MTYPSMALAPWARKILGRSSGLIVEYLKVALADLCQNFFSIVNQNQPWHRLVVYVRQILILLVPGFLQFVESFVNCPRRQRYWTT